MTKDDICARLEKEKQADLGIWLKAQADYQGTIRLFREENAKLKARVRELEWRPISEAPRAWLLRHRETRKEEILDASCYNPSSNDFWISESAKGEYEIIPLTAFGEPNARVKALEEGRIEAYYARQIEWSRQTFGPALRTKGVIDHITKELREIASAPHDLSEWVDVIILAMDGFWRHGGKPEDLMPALLAKQAKNTARKWPDWRTMSEDGAIEHDRSGEARALLTQSASKGVHTEHTPAPSITEYVKTLADDWGEKPAPEKGGE